MNLTELNNTSHLLNSYNNTYLIVSNHIFMLPETRQLCHKITFINITLLDEFSYSSIPWRED